jgi:hypothetical protein
MLFAESGLEEKRREAVALADCYPSILFPDIERLL